MNLILTEKPSVAADFAAALQCTRLDGYYQSDRWCIVNAKGHLYEQYTPDEYDERYKKWQISDLPIVPKQTLYKAKPTARNEINTIRKCLKENKITSVYLATDPGREGEAIGRIILMMNRFDFPQGIKYLRFWTAEALTRESIYNGLQNAKPLSEYDDIWQKAQIRSEIDWLIGINYTRLFSCKGKQLYSFGRVQTPVLYKIYLTDVAIINHVKSKYWSLICKAGDIQFNYSGNDEHKTDKTYLYNILNKLKDEKVLRVKEVSCKDKVQQSPQLYNISSLQIDANKKYGYSAAQTTAMMQVLYEERKLLSYPRTPSRVMGSNDYQYLKEIYDKLGIECSDNFSPENTHIFDSSQLEDHHALIVLRPAKERELSMDEQNIYDLVLTRMKMVVQPDHTYTQVNVSADIQGIPFAAGYQIVRTAGWKALVLSGKENEEEQQVLKTLVKKGDSLSISDLKVEEKETKPPQKETDASLIRWMEKNGIGTPATKYVMAETLLSRDYIVRNKKSYSITDKGTAFIQNLLKYEDFRDNLTPEFTKNFEDRIEKTDWSLKQESIRLMEDMIIKIAGDDDKSLMQNSTKYRCPSCAQELRAGQKDFYCRNCKFSIGKSIKGHKLSTKDLEDLFVNHKKTSLHNFKSAQGKDFKAYLLIEDGKLAFKFTEKKKDTK